MVIELGAEQPDWRSALEVALLRPEGVRERRADQDPWAPPPTERPRRISDDLAWLRGAFDEPENHGLHRIGNGTGDAAWEARGENPVVLQRIARLRERGVLDAAGFLLRESVN